METILKLGILANKKNAKVTIVNEQTRWTIFVSQCNGDVNGGIAKFDDIDFEKSVERATYYLNAEVLDEEVGGIPTIGAVILDSEEVEPIDNDDYDYLPQSYDGGEFYK